MKKHNLIPYQKRTIRMLVNAAKTAKATDRSGCNCEHCQKLLKSIKQTEKMLTA